ncbi:hypothetical protein GOD90_27350 [Sinorhizobium medicae]|nr:hypothetical protein [Sinorhizobium medicae]MDX0900647.1 hypothetical protein [Sinorhizobium medicae]
MGMLEDIRKWLKEIPIWQELEKVPSKLEALEARVSALEDRLKTRPGETCNKCGEHTMRLKEAGRVMGSFGNRERLDTWSCTNCGHAESRVVRFDVN